MCIKNFINKFSESSGKIYIKKSSKINGVFQLNPNISGPDTINREILRFDSKPKNDGYATHQCPATECPV